MERTNGDHARRCAEAHQGSDRCVYDADAGKKQLKAAQTRAKYEAMPEKDMERELKRVEKEMLDAAKNLEFERAAQLRDRLVELKAAMFGVAVPDET